MEGDKFGPVETYMTIVEWLDNRAITSACAGKPTMWAYYSQAAADLREWFNDVARDDWGFAGASLALIQRVEAVVTSAPPADAARLWAAAVYSRRILRSWGVPVGNTSLGWLRRRNREKPDSCFAAVLEAQEASRSALGTSR